MDDVQAMETSLAAVAGREADMRAALFDRFFAAYPDRQALFLHQQATSVRMTDETLQWMLGLSAGAKWVWGQVAELVYQHRNYGRLTAAEYADFIDMTVDALRDAAGVAWTAETETVWRDGAERLKTMVTRAIDEWTAAPLSYP